jgi:flagellin-like protein
MHPWELAQDRRGVPPVIGVVLLVAITIILAAGTATFVFGLGDEPAPVTPKTTFSLEYNNNSTGQFVEITHTGGDAVRGDQLFVRGESLGESGAWANGDGSMSGTVDSNPAVVSSDTWTVNVTGEDYVIRVIWESSDGERSAELASERGPGA